MKLSQQLLILGGLQAALAYPQAGNPATGKGTGSTLDEKAPPTKPAQRIPAEPVIPKGAKRELIQFGPFTLPVSKVWRLHFMATNSWLTLSGGRPWPRSRRKGCRIWQSRPHHVLEGRCPNRHG